MPTLKRSWQNGSTNKIRLYVSRWTGLLQWVSITYTTKNKLLVCFNLMISNHLVSKALQRALDRFCAVCDQAGMEISTKNTEVLYLRNPRQCMLQVSSNTLQQVEKFKSFGMVFTSEGRPLRKINEWIGESKRSSESTSLLCGHKNGIFQALQSC